MKKIIALLIGTLYVMSLCACDISIPIEKRPTENVEAYARTVDVSDKILGTGKDFRCTYDMDFDNVEEEILIETLHNSVDEWQSEFKVTMGEYTTVVESIDGYIENVYICDIDTSDEIRDLAVITCEQSGDVRIRIYKYEENLEQYEFGLYSPWYGKYIVDTSNWIGYPVSNYFNVNDNDTITIEEQTTSAGMWSVYKTYKLVDGRIELIEEEQYQILPDFMENRTHYFDDTLEKNEGEMWTKGYIRAYKDIFDNDITINEGEYFKVIYDDCKHNIFVEKKNGESAWIEIDYDKRMYEVNEYFFFLAG